MKVHFAAEADLLLKSLQSNCKFDPDICHGLGAMGVQTSMCAIICCSI